jgi:Flp pilus assembly protein TadD
MEFNIQKYDEAFKAFDEAIRLDPNDAEVWNYKGLALKSLGRTTEADAAFAKELGYSE